MTLGIGENSIGQLVTDGGRVLRGAVLGNAPEQTLICRGHIWEVLTHCALISFKLVVKGKIGGCHRIQRSAEFSWG
jgi:hypothetical protein